MSLYLGIDTSNYTSSAAVYCSVSKKVEHFERPLEVPCGQKGLRQSDAVFLHNRNLSGVIEEVLGRRAPGGAFVAVAASDRPRDVEGSYMPCFTVGAGYARALAAALGVPCRFFSHQCGHIAAAIHSAGAMGLLREEFLAFHASGGTTEIVRIRPSGDVRVFKTEVMLKTLDISAGQVIDRAGCELGLPFPAGPALELLAARAEHPGAPGFRAGLKADGCNFSGIENGVKRMIGAGAPPEEVAAYALEAVRLSLEAMADSAMARCGWSLPLVCAGGVMSNSAIRRRFEVKYRALFAEPEFARDNAAGIAILASVLSEGV